MNQHDREFLEEMMQERMTRIYAIDHSKRKNDIQRFTALEEKLNHALALLPEEQVKIVRQYLEYILSRTQRKRYSSTATACWTVTDCASISKVCWIQRDRHSEHNSSLRFSVTNTFAQLGQHLMVLESSVSMTLNSI